jgi:hypothetical protein
MTDDDGTPLATQGEHSRKSRQAAAAASARQSASARPGHQLRDRPGPPQGAHPKPVEEPLYFERQGSRRRAEPVVSAQEKATLERLGLTEADYKKSGERLEQSRGRSIVLGS